MKSDSLESMYLFCPILKFLSSVLMNFTFLLSATTLKSVPSTFKIESGCNPEGIKKDLLVLAVQGSPRAGNFRANKLMAERINEQVNTIFS